MMKILVTGSSGHIGRAIVVRLSKRHHVTGLDRAPASTTQWIGSIADTSLVARALEGVTVVVHTAALHAPHVGLATESDFDAVNVRATATLAQAAAVAGVQQIVFTSTTALFGAASRNDRSACWIDEHIEPQPITVYHRSKIAAEQELASVAGRDVPSVTVLRMSRCFPEPAPIMAAYRVHRGIDARDVASAHECAIQTAERGYRMYVISGATPFAPTDCEQLLHDAPTVLQERAPALVSAFAARGWRLPGTIDRVYSAQLAMSELGWRPRFGFEEVLNQYDDESPEVLSPRERWNAAE
jgi:UDP-glucose 4-epimerase